MKKLFALVIVVSSAFSCATKKEIIYFQDIDNLDQASLEKAFEPLIEPNDILHISVSSINEEVVRPFLRNPTLGPEVQDNQNPALQGYLVNSDGSIRFPVIGDFPVAGKTRAQVVDALKLKLMEYVKDVVVDVRIINFNVTILGEVRNPGVFNIANERVTIPEAIAMAGDLTEDGKRSDIVVVREENGKRKVGRIDFTSSDLFSSPFYFLKQNDVVYITPSLKGVKKSGFIPDIPALLSLFTVVLSSIIILTR